MTNSAEGREAVLEMHAARGQDLKTALEAIRRVLPGGVVAEASFPQVADPLRSRWITCYSARKAELVSADRLRAVGRRIERAGASEQIHLGFKEASYVDGLRQWRRHQRSCSEGAVMAQGFEYSAGEVWVVKYSWGDPARARQTGRLIVNADSAKEAEAYAIDTIALAELKIVDTDELRL